MNTLNDIEITLEPRVKEDIKNIDRETRQILQYKEQIRQTARDWIKSNQIKQRENLNHLTNLLREHHKNYRLGNFEFVVRAMENIITLEGSIQEFAEFFNITEDDLK